MGDVQLDGRTALVTGGNSGIGLGMAVALADAGARVAIVGRDEAHNAAAVEQLAAIQPDCQAFTLDLADAAAIEPAYAAAADAMGGFDVLVNNAGMTVRARADELTAAQFNHVLQVNLTAGFTLAQCFARERMAAEKPGSIVFTASLMSEASRPTTAAYTASNGGVRQLVKALAVDWAPFGIRVNGVGPGYIHTPLTQPLVDDPDFNAWVLKRTPLGRWGQPKDLASAAVFLASDAASFITGQILYVDGGWLATF